MSDNTHIEWTDATWNPITGCSVVSAGCKHCYAMKLAGTRLQHHPSRAGLTIETAAGPVWNGQVRFNAQWLDQPLRWKRPRRIFVCAHGDLFHESVPDEWIDKVFAVMALAPRHTFQVLTKRPERMQRYLRDSVALRGRVLGVAWEMLGHFPKYRHEGITERAFPLPNVWLGVSAENQETFDVRVRALMQCDAAIRWVSLEPLLGAIDARLFLEKHRDQDGFELYALGGIDWIVAGGESGTGARPMHPDWARSLRDQCAAASVPFLFKQWGEWSPEDAGETPHRDIAGLLPNGDVKRYSQGYVAPFDEQERLVSAGNVRLDGRTLMAFIGKKRAGRLLDGVQHDGYPA